MYVKKRVVCIISILILLFSCNFENQSTQKVVCKIIEENPPTISWSSSEELEVRSVEADVTVYSINNKKSNETKIARQFRVTQKIIQEELYSRMDFALDMQGKKRSLISNEDDKELYKQLKGVVTLSGIDQGLKLLEIENTKVIQNIIMQI